MSLNYTHFPKKFVSYETNRITCDYPNEQAFLIAMELFESQGFDTSEFYILHGDEGIKALDPDGHEHGFIATFIRKLHNMISEAEEHSLEVLVDDLNKGMIHVGVTAAQKAVRELAHQIMDQTLGRKITYYDRFYIETFENAS